MERAEQYATSWTPEGRRKVGEGGKGVRERAEGKGRPKSELNNMPKLTPKKGRRRREERGDKREKKVKEGGGEGKERSKPIRKGGKEDMSKRRGRSLRAS